MHPYTSAPTRAFWSRSVSRDLDVTTFIERDEPMIRSGELTMSAGSCFAANLVPYLERAGLQYIRTEFQHPMYALVSTENLSYAKFSAGYGNIYTTRQLLQLLQRALGHFQPLETVFEQDGQFIDPFRPGLKYRARSKVEFKLLLQQHFTATLEAFRKCDVLIFTLGLTEAWVSRQDGSVYPACPGTIAGTFDPDLHMFVNFTVDEIAADFSRFLMLLRSINPNVRVILTVSPVPLVATATGQHVVPATIYSKSVLRVAAEQLVRTQKDVAYFPAFEIITGPQAPEDYFDPDRRNPSKKGIDEVMRAFLKVCGGLQSAASTQPAPVGPVGPSTSDVLSRLLVQVECEEAMADASPAIK